MPLLTVFTPTYNRKHTIIRTYESLLRQTCKDFCWLIIDDGSTDDTREWVLSLISDERLKIKDSRFDWMGRLVESRNAKICKSVDPNSHFVIEVPFPDRDGNLQIEYVYKPNGGLYTGYNVAYATIETELCVCIDSDDFMPEDAVENMLNIWNNIPQKQQSKIAGIIGLDYNVSDKRPIGGEFRINNKQIWVSDLDHTGDVKSVCRTELMKKVAPMIGFEGEKDFNPNYMHMQVFSKYHVWIVNVNFCWVEYQIGKDSMSQAIFKQYVRSPRSYARLRLMELKICKNSAIKERYRSTIHYISSCIFSHDKNWWNNYDNKWLLLSSIPLGIILNIYIRFKAK